MRRVLLVLLFTSLTLVAGACGNTPDPNDPMMPDPMMPDNMRVASPDSSVALR